MLEKSKSLLLEAISSGSAHHINYAINFPGADKVELFKHAFKNLQSSEVSKDTLLSIASIFWVLSEETRKQILDTEVIEALKKYTLSILNNDEDTSKIKDILNLKGLYIPSILDQEVVEALKRYTVSILKNDEDTSKIQVILDLQGLDKVSILRVILPNITSCDLSMCCSLERHFKKLETRQQNELLMLLDKNTEFPQKLLENLQNIYFADLIIQLIDAKSQAKSRHIITFLNITLECDTPILEAVYIQMTDGPILKAFNRSNDRLKITSLRYLDPETLVTMMQRNPDLFIKLLDAIENKEALNQVFGDFRYRPTKEYHGPSLNLLDIAFVIGNDRIIKKLQQAGFKYSKYEHLKEFEFLIIKYGERDNFLRKYRTKLRELLDNAESDIEAEITAFRDHKKLPLDIDTKYWENTFQDSHIKKYPIFVASANRLLNKISKHETQLDLENTELFKSAILSLNVNLTRYILERSENPKALLESLIGSNILNFVSNAGHLELIQLLLEKSNDANLKRALLNNKNSNGKTMLMTVASAMPTNDNHIHQYSEIAEYLIDQGADITLSDNKGLTALHHAMEFCNKRIVEALIKKAKEFINPSGFLNAKTLRSDTAMDLFKLYESPRGSGHDSLNHSKDTCFVYDEATESLIIFTYRDDYHRYHTHHINKPKEIESILKEAGCKKAEELNIVEKVQTFFINKNFTDMIKDLSTHFDSYRSHFRSIALCGMAAVCCYDLIVRDRDMVPAIIGNIGKVCSKFFETADNLIQSSPISK